MRLSRRLAIHRAALIPITAAEADRLPAEVRVKVQECTAAEVLKVNIK